MSLAMRALSRPNNGVFFEPDANTVLFLPGQNDAYGATIHDHSSYSNHGTITGATWTQIESGLWVQNYDGADDKTTVTDDATLTDLSTFTIEAWIYPISGGEGNAGMIYGKSTRLQFAMNSTGIQVYRDRNTTVTNIYTTASLSFSNWYHVALTYDNAGTNYLYQNGVVQSVLGTQGAGTLKTDVSDATIGNNAATTQAFEGYIALLRVHNVVKTEPQLLGHVNQERHLFGV